jgi:hypothetical protein
MMMYEKKEDEEECPELYEVLGHKDVRRSCAFHILVNGEAKSAIELISPTREVIDEVGRRTLGRIASLILAMT